MLVTCTWVQIFLLGAFTLVCGEHFVTRSILERFFNIFSNLLSASWAHLCTLLPPWWQFYPRWTKRVSSAQMPVQIVWVRRAKLSSTYTRKIDTMKATWTAKQFSTAILFFDRPQGKQYGKDSKIWGGSDTVSVRKVWNVYPYSSNDWKFYEMMRWLSKDLWTEANLCEHEKDDLLTTLSL